MVVSHLRLSFNRLSNEAVRVQLPEERNKFLGPEARFQNMSLHLSSAVNHKTALQWAPGDDVGEVRLVQKLVKLGQEGLNLVSSDFGR